MAKRKRNRIIYKLAAIFFAVAFAVACSIVQRSVESSDVPAERSGDAVALSAENFMPAADKNAQVLRNIGYVSAFSNGLRVPVWVAYVVKYPFGYETVKRPSKFIKDPRAVGSAEHRDYSNSGYDRGHMAPNYAIGRSYGADAQRETFYMTNIVPQKQNMNRGVWCDIEQYIANKIAPRYGKVLVFVGPVFGKNKQYIKGSIAIPEACYAVIITRAASGGYNAVGFLVPQAPDKKSVWSYCVSIDKIEELTGIDFLPQLPDEIETKVEANASPSAFMN